MAGKRLLYSLRKIKQIQLIEGDLQACVHRCKLMNFSPSDFVTMFDSGAEGAFYIWRSAKMIFQVRKYVEDKSFKES